MSLPGQPPRGRGTEPSGAAMSAGRGAVLVGVAVVVGILILTTIDNRGQGASTTTTSTAAGVLPPLTNADGSPIVTTAPPAPAATTATTKAKKTTATTAKTDTKAARPNEQVVAQVLNGSGLQGAATQRSNDLKAKGYQVLGAGNAPAQRTGTGVQCKAGFEKEAAALVATLGALGVPATVEPVPNPLPAGFDPAANCYVLLGK
jgi:hypothetical protein